MRSKVVTNLDTSDPLEAEILDMLSGMKSSHRRQERLRSLLKAGYNLLHKNLGKEQAIAQAFDRLDHSDFSMILSLFAQSGQFMSSAPPAAAPAAPAPASLAAQETRSSPINEPPKAHVDKPPVIASEPIGAQQPAVAPVEEANPRVAAPTPIAEPSPAAGRGRYEEVSASLDDFDDSSFLDVDPHIMEIEGKKQESDDFVDPLQRLFRKQ